MKSLDIFQWAIVGGFGIWAMLTSIGFFLILCLIVGWFVSPLFVLFSSRSGGGAKFGWFLIALFFSWLGFAVFLILTQKSSQRYTPSVDRVEPRVGGLETNEKRAV